MLSKNEIKYIQSLGHKKQRDEDKAFIAEGPKVVEELLKSSFTIKKIYGTAEWLKKHAVQNAWAIEISEQELQKISGQQSPKEVLAIVEQQPLQQVPGFSNKLTLALDGIQDPGNMGTIIRTCDWFGITQIICSTDCVEIYNPKVVQATMGSIVRVEVYYKELQEVLVGCKIPVYGALLTGTSVFEISKVKEGILLMGNEGSGIRDAIQTLITYPVTIPRVGGAESLNVAMATGIILGCFRNL